MKKAAYVWDWYLKTVDEHDVSVLDIINIAFGLVKDDALFLTSLMSPPKSRGSTRSSPK